VFARAAGRVIVKLYQVLVRRRETVRPLAVKVPAAPVVEISISTVSGPVADRNASKVTVSPKKPVVGTENITPWTAAVYVVVPYPTPLEVLLPGG